MLLFKLLVIALDKLFMSQAGYNRYGGHNKSSSYNNGTESNNNDDDYSNPNRMDYGQKKRLIQDAYEFFDIDPKEASRELVKKAWKKKSLIYHPDRNQGSDESHQMMQKVNNYYEVLSNEFDKIENGIEDDCGFDDGSMDEDVKRKSAQDPSSSSKKKQKRANSFEEADEDESIPNIFRKYPTKAHIPSNKEGKKIRKQWNKAFNDLQKKRQQERRKMEEEARKERKAMNKTMKDMMKETYKMKHQAKQGVYSKYDLTTEEGRSQANEEWEDAIEKINLKKNDDFTKPMNPIMECPTDVLTVAMREGKHDLSIHIFHTRFDSFIEAGIKQMDNTKFDFSREDFEEMKYEMLRLGKKYLLKTIDDDENTILHYIAYYGSSEMIDCITHCASHHDCLTEIMLKKNLYGHIPLEYTKYRGSYIEGRMNSFTETAKDAYKEENPSFSAVTAKLFHVLRNLSLVSISKVGFSFIAGTKVFGHNWITSFIIFAIIRNKTAPDDIIGGIGKVSEELVFTALLHGTHLAWAITSWIFPSVISFIYSSWLYVTVGLGMMFCCGSSLIDWVFLMIVGGSIHILAYVASFLPVPGILSRFNLLYAYYQLIFSVGMWLVLDLIRNKNSEGESLLQSVVNDEDEFF